MTGASTRRTPSVPTSTVNGLTAHRAHYCVAGYAPNRAVSVHAVRASATASIHTNNHGSGCTDLPVGAGCGPRLAVVATGRGADGNPATSTAVVGPSAGAGCADQSAASSSGAAGTLSGGDAVLLGVAGAVLVALALIAATAMRRRRTGPPS